MVKRPEVGLATLFGGLQKQLSTMLDTTRQNATHAGTEGAAAESEWIAVLRKHLPQRYRVQRAFAIDAWGAASQQLDIVIFDAQYSPFLLNMRDMCYVPAESIYATIEVKPTLTATTWGEAQAKALSARSLIRTSAPIVHAGGVFAPKLPHRILAGVVADRCSWAGGFAGKSFQKHLWSAPEAARLDVGCVLSEGGFAVEHESGQPQVRTSKREDALVFFLLHLLNLLQRQGTVPAMDIAQYASVLRSTVHKSAISGKHEKSAGGTRKKVRKSAK